MSSPLADALSAQVQGPVLVPGAAGYDDEVAAFNLSVPIRPDVVVGATGVDDVVTAVRLAREHRVPLRVQATGHGAERPLTSGVLVTTRRLDDVVVDAATRTATVGAGVRWAAVVERTAEHGLVPVVGSSSNVGVVGFLLGGGLGPLARSHGFGSDRLVSATVVTGTGEVVEADDGEHADLLWALRGGNAVPGVVVAVRIALVEVPDLYAGSVVFDTPHVATALRGWLEWTAGADDLTTTSAAVVRMPPIDVVPEPLRGRTVLSVRFARPGSAEDGERAAAPLRALAPALLDGLGPLPARDSDRIHGDPTTPAPVWTGGAGLAHVRDGFGDAWLDAVGPDADQPFVAVELRHVAAPVSASAARTTGQDAVAGRDAAFTLGLVTVGPEAAGVGPGAAERVLSAVAPWLADEANPNMSGGLPGRWRPDVAARLDAVRRRYDPDDLLGSHAPEPVGVG
ncbi:FAD-binding oxidoreductase [Cellulomonas sp. H30R-01]|uniref:FAD-binding oxidoreductase n=1 Tax=Cellulomonas sp. H30R-01 TaxID=2704467 RepID=UPI00138BC3AD|nr:FAD-binding protein [Cellulomonas sp. H30R-01]QHT55191.1 FAD-binding oxidoreductase [Cellulomonas sp. H30R-01]